MRRGVARCASCCALQTVRRGTIKTLLIDQLPNLQYLLYLIVQVWFVDNVLKEVEGQMRRAKADGEVDTFEQLWGPIELAVVLGALNFAPVRPTAFRIHATHRTISPSSCLSSRALMAVRLRAW